MIQLPDRDLAYFPEGSEHFDDYVDGGVLGAGLRAREPRTRCWSWCWPRWRGICRPSSHRRSGELPPQLCGPRSITTARTSGSPARARSGRATGDLGIIPGSMGARSYIVRGKGNPESFCSCAHGAGRRMSRTAAEQQFTVADLAAQTAGRHLPQGQGRDRRDPRRLQGHRPGHGQPGRPGGGGAYPEAGGVREGVKRSSRRQGIGLGTPISQRCSRGRLAAMVGVTASDSVPSGGRSRCVTRRPSQCRIDSIEVSAEGVPVETQAAPEVIAVTVEFRLTGSPAGLPKSGWRLGTMRGSELLGG